MYRAPGPDGALRLGPQDQNIVCDYYYTQPLLVVGLGLAHWPSSKRCPVEQISSPMQIKLNLLHPLLLLLLQKTT